MCLGRIAMNWLRLRAQKLSLLALFALAMQFGLSFGHNHLDRTFIGTALSSQIAVSSPDTNGDGDTRNDVCAICTTVAMTGSAVNAAPPTLPHPINFVATEIFSTGGFIRFEARRPVFQSRAPPLV